MAEEAVTKTIENVDELYSTIIVNGETFTSNKVNTTSSATQITETDTSTKTNSTDTSTKTNSTETEQGDDVEVIELNDISHNVTDKALTDFVNNTVNINLNNEINNRKSADSYLQYNIESETSAREAGDTALQTDISTINSYIPGQTSISNQLADKDFVNSSIATNTAYFKGTFSSVEDLPTEEVTNNDYAFVSTTDTAGNIVYKRYKYNADTSSWVFEYDLNNSSFTAEQWASINSGITSDEVEIIATIDTKIANAVALAITTKLSGYFPKGYIFVSTTDTNPADFFGFGTWEKKGEGRVLQGADSTHSAGTTIEAGLPDITGGIHSIIGAFEGATGAFSQSGSNWVTNATSVLSKDSVTFSASTGETKLDGTVQNDVYGKSDTVQPPAYCVYFWERVA